VYGLATSNGMNNTKIIAPKLVSDPIWGMINIRPVLPIVESPEFQQLGYKYQLGMTFLTFPSATHTRKAHSLGAYHATKDLCRRWREFGMINKEEAKAIPIYGLLHDIGHYPFSHVTEPLFPISHDDKGIKIVEGLKSQIEKCGLDFELVRSLSNHTNHLYLAVHDKNLGMEKLDYLERDGRSTITDRPPGINYLRPYIYWINGQIVIDEKAIDVAKDAQDFYAKMFKNVYLRKNSVIAQRHFQKMVYLLLQSEEMTIQELETMNDFELLGRLSVAKDLVVQELFRALKNRELFREGVVFRYKDFVHAERVAAKHITVMGMDDSAMLKFTDSKLLSDHNQASLLEVETKIAKALGLEAKDILLITVVSPERFITQDISILRSNGEVSSLKKDYPNHFSDLAETAKSYTALRICSSEKHREKLSKNAELVRDIIFDAVN